jgi:CRP/FNR family transcriptional regulator, anaerobic regulatory protein
VFTTSGNGREILFGFVGPGEVIGEIEYFADEPIRSTVEAAVRTEAWLIPSRSVHALLDQQPGLAIALARTMARRYYRDVERSAERITYPIAHNVLRICLARMTDRRDPCIQLPKRDLATYLGTSSRHLNRVLRDLADRNAIEIDVGQVRKVNAHVARALMDTAILDRADSEP